MKKAILTILLFGLVSLFAQNYEKMSTDELMSLRGKVPVENIELFGAELSSRVHAMKDDELRKYGIWDMIKKDSHLAGCNCTAKKPLKDNK